MWLWFQIPFEKKKKGRQRRTEKTGEDEVWGVAKVK